MTQYELTSSIFEGVALLDGGFETWMAATFAIIIVAHTSGSNLNIVIKCFLAILYLLITSLLVLRHNDIAIQVAYFAAQLPQHDSSASVETIQFSGFLRKTVFLLGTAGSVIFLLVPKFHKKKQ